MKEFVEKYKWYPIYKVIRDGMEVFMCYDMIADNLIDIKQKISKRIDDENDLYRHRYC